ncbi:MAG TPA: threonine synthase [Candidatus Bathyarchaeia archaeon]|nr:threonine synthase [Candidatus Bathyarchaeia archaeon]
MNDHYQCIGCNSRYETSEMMYTCAECSDLLEVKYDYEKIAPVIDTKLWRSRIFSAWRYRELLPISPETRIVSLGEGGTGLHRSEHLAEDLKVNTLSVKFEGENPTGSFKDRGMTVSISKAVEVHAKMVACASTGNTSASLAAYAARAGLRCIVIVPADKIAQGKLAQAIAHGAMILEIEGNFDDALRAVIELTERNRSIALLNSVNPFRIEGQKTLAFEVCDQMNFKPPDVLIVPVGNAGNISSIWKGFDELRRLGVIDKTPRLVGIQAEGASPIASAYKLKSATIQPVKNPETIATAIRIGAPASWKKALRAIAESGGAMETASDAEILQAQKELARREGIFVEPASASSIAGLRKLLEQGSIEKDEEIVCVATGHGLKDPEVVTKIGEKPTRTKSDRESIERVLGLR